MSFLDKSAILWIFLVLIGCSYSQDIDGGVSEWQEWGDVTCDQTCGVNVTGTRTRLRGCDNPLRRGNGKTCLEKGLVQQESSRILCDNIPKSCNDIVDGGYGEWSQWAGATCTKTCGVGVTVNIWRNRSCDRPAPQNGGHPCNGTNYESTSMECPIPPCPDDVVDGGYSQWTQWTADACPETCGVQIRKTVIRYRRCDSPEPLNGGERCNGSNYQQKFEVCEGIPQCPDDLINGTYGEWGPWTTDQCFLTCGVKVQTVQRRSRSCDSPAPQNGGLPCQGSSTQTRQIDCEGVAPCPVDGGYGDWSQWAGATCTKTCGVGVTVNIWRNRSCDSPASQNGGLPCNGTNYESTSMECPIPPCPGDVVDGGYSQWSQWTAGPCPETCEVQIRKVLNRYRRCDSPEPLNGGKPCEGPYVQQKFEVCEGIPPCPDQVVNGRFSQWSEWTQTSCPETCGVEVETLQRRSRACDNPPPFNGGVPCYGSTSQERNGTCANLSLCPVDGGVSEWGEWDTPRCPTCGENVTGVSLRLRPCNNPVPANGGSFCNEPVQEIVVRSCEVARCPVDGGFSEWGEWSNPDCPVTCGLKAEKIVSRKRICTEPPPQFGGANCTGPTEESTNRSCSHTECPIDGGFSEWGEWRNPDCPVTCGREAEKVVSRNRSCSEPPPQFGGANCAGPTVEIANRSCNHTECAIDGGLSEWGAWSNPNCTVSCGREADKVVSRNRSCTEPPPQFGGTNCTGPTEESTNRSCNQTECIILIIFVYIYDLIYLHMLNE